MAELLGNVDTLEPNLLILRGDRSLLVVPLLLCLGVFVLVSVCVRWLAVRVRVVVYLNFTIHSLYAVIDRIITSKPTTNDHQEQ